MTLDELVAQIRMLTPKPKEQSLDDWYTHTYDVAYQIWQATHPVPPRVVKQKERSDRLRGRVGEPEKEIEDD